MKRQYTFEDRLSEWLEDGPADAPDSVVETILAAFPSIPQRRGVLRVPWRFPYMNGYARALAGIAAVAVVAVVALTLLNRPPAAFIGGPGSPSPSPSVAPSSGPTSPTPSATPINTTAWKSFTSTRHGETMRYPSDWTATAATAPWPAGTPGPVPPDPMLDVFTAPGTNAPTFVVISQALPKGTTANAWLTPYEQSGAASFPAQCWPAPAQMERATVGGLSAWIHGGVSGCGFTEAIVFAGGRVYELSAYENPQLSAPFDRALFDAFLSTVRIDPSKANDRPAASAVPSPT